MADLADVRAIALPLPRAYEAVVRDFVKFCVPRGAWTSGRRAASGGKSVGRIVFASVSPDETLLGFGYPREAREGLVASNPEVFLMPVASDLRYQWVRLRLARIDRDELAELLVGAWEMCVPKSVAAQWAAAAPTSVPPKAARRPEVPAPRRQSHRRVLPGNAAGRT